MHWCPRSFSLITLICLSFADALRIDDFDTKVQYQGAWTDGQGIPDNASLNWDSTLHYSNISNATATITFTGTSIAVYGSFHPPGRYSMQSQYSVDGQQPFIFLPTQEVPISTHQTLFYSSPQFLYGEHTLVVTNLGEQLFIDFFDVENETVPTSPSTTPTASTTTPALPTWASELSSGNSQTATAPTISPQPGTSASSATSDPHKTSLGLQPTFVTATSLAVVSTPPSPSESPSPSPGTAWVSSLTTAGGTTATPIGAAQSPMQRSSRGLSKGAIAGIAVGSIIIVAVLGAGLWWYRRSRERTCLVTDLHFEPEKMSVPDPNFRGHRPTLPGLDAREGGVMYGGHRASEHRRSMPSSSIHLIGYGSSPPSTCSE